MAVSSLNSYPTSNDQVVNINRNNKEPKSSGINQNGQIQIYQSSYRGSYFSICLLYTSDAADE